MKSQVNSLLLVVEGLLKDVSLTYPPLKGGLSKDLDRLTLYCQTRGLTLFTLDLPHLESLLLSGLEEGRLRLEGPLSSAVSSSAKVPRLFSGLWLRVFDKVGCLKQEPDVNALFFLRQLLVIGKKIEVNCSDLRTQAKIGEYHDIERELRAASLNWQHDELLNIRDDTAPSGDVSTGAGDRYGRHFGDLDLFPSPVPETREQRLGDEQDPEDVDWCIEYDHPPLHLVQAVDHVYPGWSESTALIRKDWTEEDGQVRLGDIHLLNRIQKVADLIFGSFDHVDPVTFSGYLEQHGHGTGFKHGPGAVAERLKNWEKSQFPNWPHKLQNTFPFEFCGTTAGSRKEQPVNHEPAARLICVPKTAKGPRLIAAEPVAHQWCQQLLLRFLFDQCRAHFGVHFIDFKDQSKSGRLVLKASLDRDLATVDLSDASDRLTCWTVERMMRHNLPLLIALHAARTRYIRDEISDVPGFLSLRKFASQGTATTFPVMSLVMLCIALGAVLSDSESVTWGTLRKYRTQVRVFGDDIIIPAHGYGALVRAMELLQLRVNTAKSYVHGHFRESCGTDGYLGYNVTPVKPRTLMPDSPASCQAVVDTSNNLFNKGLWYASQSAESLLPAHVRKYNRTVGIHGAGSGGFTSFVGSDERHLVSRWNPRLHRKEVRVWSVQGQSQKKPRNDVEGLLDFFARSHSTRNPRVVSEYFDVRKTKTRLLWEPSDPDARTHDQYFTDGQVVRRIVGPPGTPRALQHRYFYAKGYRRL